MVPTSIDAKRERSFLVTRGEVAIMLDFVDEPLDQIALLVEQRLPIAILCNLSNPAF